jgi:hypothetical protein
MTCLTNSAYMNVDATCWSVGSWRRFVQCSATWSRHFIGKLTVAQLIVKFCLLWNAWVRYHKELYLLGYNAE